MRLATLELPHLGNRDESFPRNHQVVRQLDVAGQDQHQLVARTEAVIEIDRPVERGLKEVRGALEDVHAEHLRVVSGDASESPRRLSAIRRARVREHPQRFSLLSAHDPQLLYGGQDTAGWIADVGVSAEPGRY